MGRILYITIDTFNFDADAISNVEHLLLHFWYNGNETKMQRMGYMHIPCIKVKATIDTTLKFDANTDTNVDIHAKCERTFTPFNACDPLKEVFFL